MGAFVLMYVMTPIPAGNAAAKLQSNVYKYSDGSILARTGEVNRENVDLAQVPKEVQTPSSPPRQDLLQDRAST